MELDTQAQQGWSCRYVGRWRSGLRPPEYLGRQPKPADSKLFNHMSSGKWTRKTRGTRRDEMRTKRSKQNKKEQKERERPHTEPDTRHQYGPIFRFRLGHQAKTLLLRGSTVSIFLDPQRANDGHSRFHGLVHARIFRRPLQSRS